MSFKEINLTELNINPFTSIGSDWMLITSGSMENHNTMTASWGGLGVLWGKNVAFCFIRPQRYTLEFVDKEDCFTLSFFNHEQYKSALNFCGSKSGRDFDKDKETGLVPTALDGSVAYKQASLVFVIKKLHRQDIDPSCFIDPSLDSHYKQKDYHKMFVGEIVKCYVRD